MQQEKLMNTTLLALENSLKGKFHPIEPDQQFVQQLRKRLEGSPILFRRRRTAATLLTIAGGLLFGLAVFLLGRGFLSQSSEAR
jgi:hypothetical protein